MLGVRFFEISRYSLCEIEGQRRPIAKTRTADPGSMSLPGHFRIRQRCLDGGKSLAGDSGAIEGQRLQSCKPH